MPRRHRSSCCHVLTIASLALLYYAFLVVDRRRRSVDFQTKLKARHHRDDDDDDAGASADVDDSGRRPHAANATIAERTKQAAASAMASIQGMASRSGEGKGKDNGGGAGAGGASHIRLIDGYENDDDGRYEAALYLLRTYVDQHSVDRLEEEWRACLPSGYVVNASIGETGALGDTAVPSPCPSLTDRRYALGYYACPQQAGNRLHTFLTSLAWSVVTNRTLLWRYFDKDTCRILEPGQFCPRAGTKSTCDETLHINDWIPSYDSWQERVSTLRALPEKGLIVQEASWWSTHIKPSEGMESRKHPWETDSGTFAGTIDALDDNLLYIGHQPGTDAAVLTSETHRLYLLGMGAARERAAVLFGAFPALEKGIGGSAFPYGMLFHASFRLNKSLLPDQNLVPDDPETTTIALHSRHPDLKDSGSNVERETACLKAVLERKKVDGDSRRKPCVVYLMSDRPQSLLMLSDVVRLFNCTPITADNSEDRISGESPVSMLPPSVEHGQYAGRGFFRDLALASTARFGIIAGQLQRRSSSKLVEELMEYGRVVVGADDDDDPNIQRNSSAHRYSASVRDNKSKPFIRCTW